MVQIPLPRKGTETLMCGSSEPSDYIGSNSTTPQGDGNLPVAFHTYHPLATVQIPLPRKGTETVNA